MVPPHAQADPCPHTGALSQSPAGHAEPAPGSDVAGLRQNQKLALLKSFQVLGETLPKLI